MDYFPASIRAAHGVLLMVAALSKGSAHSFIGEGGSSNATADPSLNNHRVIVGSKWVWCSSKVWLSKPYLKHCMSQ